jgi:hypothetical protein
VTAAFNELNRCLFLQVFSTSFLCMGREAIRLLRDGWQAKCRVERGKDRQLQDLLMDCSMVRGCLGSLMWRAFVFRWFAHYTRHTGQAAVNGEWNGSVVS